MNKFKGVLTTLSDEPNANKTIIPKNAEITFADRMLLLKSFDSERPEDAIGEFISHEVKEDGRIVSTVKLTDEGMEYFTSEASKSFALNLKGTIGMGDTDEDDNGNMIIKKTKYVSAAIGLVKHLADKPSLDTWERVEDEE